MSFPQKNVIPTKVGIYGKTRARDSELKNASVLEFGMTQFNLLRVFARKLGHLRRKANGADADLRQHDTSPMHGVGANSALTNK